MSDFVPEKSNAAGADESFKFLYLDLDVFFRCFKFEQRGSAVLLKREKRSQIPIDRAVEEPDPVKGSGSRVGVRDCSLMFDHSNG